MKAPAVIILSIILAMTIAFLWAITPRPNKVEPVPQKVAMATKTKPMNNTKTALTSVQKIRAREHAKGWSAIPSYSADFNALDPSYKVASVSDSLFNPADDYWGLPRDAKGAFELVDAYCTACHSVSIVMQQRATPERWKELLIWMVEKQGMAKMPAEDEALALAYISTHFSTK